MLQRLLAALAVRAVLRREKEAGQMDVQTTGREPTRRVRRQFLGGKRS